MRRVNYLLLILLACLIQCSSHLSPEWQQCTLMLQVLDPTGEPLREYELAVMLGEPTGNTAWETSYAIGKNSYVITQAPHFKKVYDAAGEVGYGLQSADTYTIHVRHQGELFSGTARILAKAHETIWGRIRLNANGGLSFEEEFRMIEEFGSES
jgi:hypothetical protein